MPEEQDIALLCRETQSLRSRALVVAGEAARCMSELRQSLAKRSDLLHWSEEVNASAPTMEAAMPPASSGNHGTQAAAAPGRRRRRAGPQRTPSAGVERQDLRPRQADRKGKPEAPSSLQPPSRSARKRTGCSPRERAPGK